MPVVTFRIPAVLATDARCKQLLEKGSLLYAELLDSPLERVRAFVQSYNADHMSVGGSVSHDSNSAFFEYYVLAGRPKKQRHAVMFGFTDLLVSVLEIDPRFIRGACIQVDADDWCIAGSPASAIRSAEIAARNAEG